MAKRPHIDNGHVVWAYDEHIARWYDEGLSVAAIRRELQKVHLHVGRDAIRAVLWDIRPRPRT